MDARKSDQISTELPSSSVAPRLRLHLKHQELLWDASGHQRHGGSQGIPGITSPRLVPAGAGCEQGPSSCSGCSICTPSLRRWGCGGYFRTAKRTALWGFMLLLSYIYLPIKHINRSQHHDNQVHPTRQQPWLHARDGARFNF